MNKFRFLTLTAIIIITIHKLDMCNSVPIENKNYSHFMRNQYQILYRIISHIKGDHTPASMLVSSKQYS